MNLKTANIFERSQWVGLVLFAIGTALSISLEETGAFLAMLSFGILVLFRQEIVKRSIIDIPFFLILSGLLISAIFVSPDKLKSLKKIVNDLWMVPLFYVIISSLTVRKYKKLLEFVFWASLIAAVYGIWQSFTGIDFIIGRDLRRYNELYFASGFWGLHLTYGGFMGMVSVIALGYAMEISALKKKYFYYCTAGLTFAASVLSFSRSAIVGVLAGLFFFFTINIRKTYKVFLVMLIILILLFSFSDSLKQRMHGVFSPSYLHNIYRYEIWVTAVNMIRHHPIFGVGGGNFKLFYNQYKDPAFVRDPIGHAHNDLLNMYIEGGILAFLGFISLFALLLIYGLRSYFMHRSSLLLGLLASAVTMFFQGLSQCYFTDAENGWLFWFAVSGIVLYVRLYRDLYEKDPFYVSVMHLPGNKVLKG